MHIKSTEPLDALAINQDKHGISVILAAIWEGHFKCVKFLLEKVRIDFEFLRQNEGSSVLFS